MNNLVKTTTWLLGIVLVILGIVGFFNDPIFGLFDVDSIHNVIHLASGIIAIVAAVSGESYARLFLIVFGIIYGLLAIVGFVSIGAVLGLMTINEADNYLHAAISLVSLAVGFGGSRVR